MYSSLIPSFMSFTAVGLIIVAMLGVGVAEESGLVNSLIRKLVTVSPRWALCYILVFVGILSSIAADAGYLVLIPLAGTAFLSVRRHPLAGLATGFAAVAGAFTVNMLIKPLDAILTEFTNDAIHLVDPSVSIGLTANLWFSIASVLFLTVLVTLITERVVEPRLGKYQGEQPAEEGGGLSADESRGLKYALLGLIAVLAVFGFLTIPAEAPLRNPDHGRAHRRLAVHERPDRRDHGVVLGDGSGVWHRRQNDEEPHGHHQGDGKGAVEPGQSALAVVCHQPIRGVLQLQQHRNHHGDEDGRSCSRRRISARCGC